MVTNKTNKANKQKQTNRIKNDFRLPVFVYQVSKAVLKHSHQLLFDILWLLKELGFFIFFHLPAIILV